MSIIVTDKYGYDYSLTENSGIIVITDLGNNKSLEFPGKARELVEAFSRLSEEGE